MVRLLLRLLVLLPVLAVAQVEDGEMVLTVTVEELPETPYVGEMILLTIEGAYRLPITLEKLAQPDLEGFSWMQLGLDYWTEDTVRGLKVKRFRRRMAVFANRPGTLEIGAFRHNMTLLDRSGQRFEHQVTSEPVTLRVRPAPEQDGWWLPVRRLEITDSWSNPPDQLAHGQGALRIINVRALGLSPEMLPPMPELTAPTAHVFPHPEKRLADLTPYGPVAVAFWRWTIQPAEPPSAILEPIEFEYFDTVARVFRQVRIAPQRMAYAEQGAPEKIGLDTPYPLRGPLLAAVTILTASAGVIAGLAGQRLGGFGEVVDTVRRALWRRRLRAAAARGDLVALRRLSLMLNGDGPTTAARAALFADLDRALYARNGPDFSARAYAAAFVRDLRRSQGRR